MIIEPITNDNMFLIVLEEMHVSWDIRAQRGDICFTLGVALTSEMAVNNRSPSKAGAEQLMSNLPSAASG